MATAAMPKHLDVEATITKAPTKYNAKHMTVAASVGMAAVTILLLFSRSIVSWHGKELEDKNTTSREDRKSAAEDRKFIQDKMFEGQAKLIDALNTSATSQREAALNIKEGMYSIGKSVSELADQQKELIMELKANAIADGKGL